ncbi:unnamed protein product, partial [Rotaria sp. Silwood1]
LPLSMLLYLLTNGRQLTFDEIDHRVIVFIYLKKKAKMLTLPSDTLSPLSAPYVTKNKFNHQTDNTRPVPILYPSHGKSSLNVSTSIAEQIPQILTTNIDKPTTSTSNINSQLNMSKVSLDKSSNIVKVENMNIPQSNNYVIDSTKEYVQQQHNSSSSF